MLKKVPLQTDEEVTQLKSLILGTLAAGCVSRSSNHTGSQYNKVLRYARGQMCMTIQIACGKKSHILWILWGPWPVEIGGAGSNGLPEDVQDVMFVSDHYVEVHIFKSMGTNSQHKGMEGCWQSWISLVSWRNYVKKVYNCLEASTFLRIVNRSPEVSRHQITIPLSPFRGGFWSISLKRRQRFWTGNVICRKQEKVNCILHVNHGDSMPHQAEVPGSGPKCWWV